jgi:hypothetical protein
MIRSKSNLGECCASGPAVIDIVAPLQPTFGHGERRPEACASDSKAVGPSMLAERYKTIGIADAICVPRGRGSSEPLRRAVRTRTVRGPASRMDLLAGRECRREWVARSAIQGGSGHALALAVQPSWNSHTRASAGGSCSHRCKTTNRRHKPARRRALQVRERQPLWRGVHAPSSYPWLLTRGGHGSGLRPREPGRALEALSTSDLVYCSARPPEPCSRCIAGRLPRAVLPQSTLDRLDAPSCLFSRSGSTNPMHLQAADKGPV